MVMGLQRRVAAILAAALCTAMLAGCGEEEQLLLPATGDPLLERQDRDRQLRERAQSQGESARFAY